MSSDVPQLVAGNEGTRPVSPLAAAVAGTAAGLAAAGLGAVHGGRAIPHIGGGRPQRAGLGQITPGDLADLPDHIPGRDDLAPQVPRQRGVADVSVPRQGTPRASLHHPQRLP